MLSLISYFLYTNLIKGEKINSVREKLFNESKKSKYLGNIILIIYIIITHSIIYYGRGMLIP